MVFKLPQNYPGESSPCVREGPLMNATPSNPPRQQGGNDAPPNDTVCSSLIGRSTKSNCSRKQRGASISECGISHVHKYGAMYLPSIRQQENCRGTSNNAWSETLRFAYRNSPRKEEYGGAYPKRRRLRFGPPPPAVRSVSTASFFTITAQRPTRPNHPNRNVVVRIAHFAIMKIIIRPA